MKRIIIVVLAVAGIVLAGTSANAGGSKPKYTTPQSVSFVYGTDVSAEIAHRAVPYADFYKVQASTRKDFSKNVTTLITEFPGANSHTVEGLNPGTKYYFRVAVSNSRGDRLSDYSKVASGTTETEPPNWD